MKRPGVARPLAGGQNGFAKRLETSLEIRWSGEGAHGRGSKERHRFRHCFGWHSEGIRRLRKQAMRDDHELMVLHRLIREQSSLSRKNVRTELADPVGVVCGTVLEEQDGVEVAIACRAATCMAPKDDQVND